MDTGITGGIEVTTNGWLHIWLDTLLPHCRFGFASDISDAIQRLLISYDGVLPFFDYAFLIIDEHNELENRRVFDQDNKGWKAIPNALKGKIIADDNQDILSLCLLSKHSKETRCHIYVMPPEDAFGFFYERFGSG